MTHQVGISKMRDTAKRLKPILILGMHRSGTSLAGEIIDRWGAYGGEQENMMPATQENPRGYWEYLPLVELNDELLTDLDSSWCVPPADDAAVQSRAGKTQFRRKAESLIKAMNRSKRTWYWKDPRLSILLPYWLKVLPNPTIIVCLRNPLEIADSLKSRRRMQGFSEFEIPESAALLLWQIYLMRIFLNIPTVRNVFLFPYEAALKDPTGQCKRLLSFLEGIYGKGTDDKLVRMVDVVKKDLMRSRRRVAIGSTSGATAGQKKLARFADARARGDNSKFRSADYPLYEGWRDYLRAVERAGALTESGLLALRKKVAELENLVNERTQWAKSTVEELQKAREYIQMLQQVLANITSSKGYRVLDALGMVHSEPH